MGVERPGIDRVYSKLRANVLNARVPSGTSRVVLGRYDLEATWRAETGVALERLLALAAKDDRRDSFFALAELHLLAALEGRGAEHALASAAFSWEFLFAPAPGKPPEPWDALFRDAADIHARALLEAFRAEPGNPEIRLEAGTRLLPNGSMKLAVDTSGIDTSGNPAYGLFAADEYGVRGLRVRQRRGGIGLPLVAKPPLLGDAAVPGLVYSGRAPFAVTAVLRVEGGMASIAEGRVRATVSLLDSAEAGTLRVGTREVPLAADFSAPFALGLENSRIWSFELGGFTSGNPDFPPGLIPTAPYRPGRIPVVLVHGTASSPARWAEMVNTLYGEERIRSRYQFWLFIYATGNPVPYSASLLRKSLAEAVAKFDPQGKDAALRRMVLIGHSQGGLLCRMAASSSEDFVAAQGRGLRLDDLALDEADRALLRECLIFRASPLVSRVVYICTPHRGSFLAGTWIGSLSSAFVNFGGRLMDVARLEFRPGRGTPEFPVEMDLPTSVDNMSPESPFLRAYGLMEPGAGVLHHTVAAVDGEGDPKGLDDGVVTYESACVPGAASEFVVRWGHSCQSHPLVVEEVRRILLEHAAPPPGSASPREADKSPGPAR